MAENQDGQEKSEEPTAKRISDAREKGQVARSREFNTFFMMIVASAFLLVAGDRIIDGLLDVLRQSFVIPRERIFDPTLAVLFFQENIFQGLVIVAPLFVVLTVVAVFSSVMIGGWNFSWQALAPKFSKLDPIKGIKRVFGARGLIELVKGLAKFLVIGAVAVALLAWQAESVLKLGYQALEPALAEMGEQLAWFFLVLCATLIVIAAMDVPYQLWEHKRQLKMTHQEVKEERKQTDGSPEVKGRIRQLQYEMAQRRMMSEVPKADVVITNPTHYAVALRYDQNKMNAPRVVAKGKDLVAGQIRSVANAHNVPILSAPPLARALYYSTSLNQEVPAGLYLAVAKVLAYIFQLRDKGRRFRRPLHMGDVPIPEEYRRDE